MTASHRALSKEDGLSAGEIGRRVFIKPGTITGILDRLEAKGLVERTRVNKDRRIVNITITKAGRELVQAAPVPIQSTLAINLKKLPLDEVEAIMRTEKAAEKFKKEPLPPHQQIFEVLGPWDRTSEVDVDMSEKSSSQGSDSNPAAD